ncbi:branched-chain amino acid ABC transporter permease [Rhodovibrio salinarum]|uniref:Branched-chain amino acid ABC transporter permease n=1 Tax=Rhodovibrio salinarum TaxID=1087 RepID=A0A934QJX9_9PROT|nr:branched-chain amino acid ABC transporter permease [Rhodovibrio salinarum]MBK1698221.1 branched-chain amino acid ABC transporter permease [Rhodovibrio salinarum]
MHNEPTGAVGARATGAKLLVGLGAVALLTGYIVAFLMAEEESVVAGLIVAAGVVVLGAYLMGLLAQMRAAYRDHERLMHAAILLGVLVVAWVFREDHFTLLMLTTAMLYMTACLGLNVQLGYTGVLNFAGASFFGVGCYTAAVLGAETAIPPLLILPIGGVMAALVGSVLVIPVLRTRGHYAAVVTIAFAVLFRTFLQVNDALGGPQGLSVPQMSLFGWGFNSNIEIGSFYASFYMNYYLLALLLLVMAFALTRRIERSWVGLSMDATRIDELAASCFGITPARWKITAFMFGNFLIGMAGALLGMMISFIAPANFTFADSLIFLSIVLLGGMGSVWGIALASAIVVLLPEKLQMIQEYRFLLFAALVILVLLFRPNGLLPRGRRAYFPDWRPR